MAQALIMQGVPAAQWYGRLFCNGTLCIEFDFGLLL